MTSRSCCIPTACLFLAASSAFQGAAGQDLTPLECTPFELITGERRADFGDTGDSGPSIGDIRAGTTELLDKDGNKRGKVHYSATLVDIGAEGQTIVDYQVYVLDSGGMIALSQLFLPSVSDTARRATDGFHVVVGGTGTFQGVQGEIQFGAVKEGKRTITFDIGCD
ncbi:MAG TPA: hypothetical protein VKN76_11570 [Kiloniellaceae bacterium]|nr:hypothetical protein [Kiloniellaceae bacterium]